MDTATTLAGDAARLVELSDLQVVDGAIVGFPAPVHPRDMRRLLLLHGSGGPEAQRLLRYAEAVTAHLGRLADAAADRLFGVANEPAPETPRGRHKRARDADPDGDGGGEVGAARGAPRRVAHRDDAEELAAAALSDEHPAAALRDEDWQQFAYDAPPADDFLLPVSPGDEDDGCTVYDQEDEDFAFLPMDPAAAADDDDYMFYGDQQHGSVTPSEVALDEEDDGQFALEAEEDFVPLDPVEDAYGQCLLPVDPTEDDDDDDDVVYEQCGGVTPDEAALGENEEQFELELGEDFVPLDPAEDDYVVDEDYTQFASEQEDFIPVDPTEDDDDGGGGDMVYSQNFNYNRLRPALDGYLEVAENSP